MSEELDAQSRDALTKAADAYEAFVTARNAMNAARPAIDATPAERALYDERYRADHAAEREHWETAIGLAQCARSILGASSPAKPAPAEQREESAPSIWPLGHGVVMTAAGEGDFAGHLFFAAVPDEMIGEPGQAGDKRGFQSLMSSNGPRMIIRFADEAAIDAHIALCEQARAALSTAQAQEPVTGERDPTDMEAVGNALMDAIEKDYASHPFMKGWHPADCPTEIVGDLLNALDEAASPPASSTPDAREIVDEMREAGEDVMIGEFIARWEGAADGVTMDAETAEALARAFKRMKADSNAAQTVADAIRSSFFTSVSGGGQHYLSLAYRTMDAMREAEGHIKSLIRALPLPTPSAPDAALREHWSDCAVHNEPALPNGPCDCGGYSVLKDRERLAMIIAEALARSDGLKFGQPYKPWERHGYVAADTMIAALSNSGQMEKGA